MEGKKKLSRSLLQNTSLPGASAAADARAKPQVMAIHLPRPHFQLDVVLVLFQLPLAVSVELTRQEAQLPRWEN